MNIERKEFYTYTYYYWKSYAVHNYLKLNLKRYQLKHD